MQRSISISALIPLFQRPASPPRVSPVRLKVASIAWAAALIAVGLGPARRRRTTANRPPSSRCEALPALAIGASTKVAPLAKPARSLALHGEYQTYLETSDAHARGPSGFTSRNPWRGSPKGTWSSTPPPRAILRPSRRT